MKKIFIYFLFSFFIIQVSGNFDSESEIVGSSTYSKVEGVHTLYLRQKHYIYNSDGSLNSITWARSAKTYRYDISQPFCQGVTLYDSSNNYTPLILGDWTNKNVRAKIKCFDVHSGCVNEYSDYLLVGHLDEPGTTFADNAGNKNTCKGNLEGKKILLDQILPQVQSISFGGTEFIRPGNSIGPGISKKAGVNNFSLIFEDTVTEGSAYGISGIKNYNFDLTYIQDHKGNDINKLICNKSESYISYNLDGSIKIGDKKNISFLCDEQENGIEKIFKTGKYRLDFSIEDYAGNIKKIMRYITIYPSDLHNTYSNATSLTQNDKYANNFDNYTYTLELKDIFGNPIYNKQVNLIDQDSSYYFTGGKTITTDMTNNSGSDALLEAYSGTTNLDGKIDFTLRSLTPGIFTEIFNIKMNIWNNNYENQGSLQSVHVGGLTENSFKKPFIGELLISNTGDFDDIVLPEVGPEQIYKIKVLSSSTLLSGQILNLSGNNSLVATVEGHILKDFVGNKTQNFDTSIRQYPKFETRIDAFSNVLKAPGIETNKLIIGYLLGGESIRYYLTANDISNDSTEFGIKSDIDEETLGLRVIGTLQGAGKSSLTGQEENFSDLTKSELRETIRKNAYTLIKGLTSGMIINGIKYIEGDYELTSSESGYETLIVKNGNVIIGGNIDNNIGIIVLKDNYNVYTDYTKEGNVYVKPHVGYINALIYADGGFISSDTTGDPIIYDSDTRRSILSNQLVLEGTLFTRNTIGGSVLGPIGMYNLPGGQLTDIFNRSMVYDLNYNRTGNKNKMDNYNRGYENPFIIIYNPEIQTNPPKGFSK